jgi:hypothetical protein
MLHRVRAMKTSSLMSCLTILMLAGAARAQGSDEPPDTARPAYIRRAGESSIIELDALAGTSFGLRVKGIIHPASSWNLSLEGFDGASLVNPDGSLLRTERGGGARIELPVSADRHNLALLAPGVDLLYAPRTAADANVLPPLAYNGRDPALLLDPGLEFMIVHELVERACLLGGLHGAAAIYLDGHDGSGKHLAGTLRPDVSVYAGMRF